MPLLSASDDFRARTLASIEGTLQRLAYIIGLHKRAGQYSHWGLVRTFGPEAAHQAVAANHSDIWIEVLRTPLQELAGELDNMTPEERSELIATLTGSSNVACPKDLNGGTIPHFNATVLALRLLSRAQGATQAA